MKKVIGRGVITIPEMIERGAREFHNRPALIKRQGNTYIVTTYSEMAEEVESIANALVSMGLRPSQRVAILGTNSPEWAKAYLSILKAGGVCVPLDSLLTQNEIIHLLMDSGARFAFISNKFIDAILEKTDAFEVDKNLIILEEKSISKLIEIGRNKSMPNAHTPPSLDDTASIIYTSGTTGNPKGVMLTHRNIISDCAACYEAVGILEDEHFLSVLPMHHTLECTAGFLLPLYSGCRITFARSLRSKYIIEDLKASRATVMIGVPLLFQKMLEGIYRAVDRQPISKRLAFKAMLNSVKVAERAGVKWMGRRIFKGLREKAGLGAIKFFIVGGAPIREQIIREFRYLGINVLQGYGLTEASPVLTLNPVDNPKDKSIGRPLPTVKVKVVEPNNEGMGELSFKGPMIMKGYYKNITATKDVLTDDGWLLTGDMGFIDEDGYCYISGRAKNLIVTPAGKNVYPEELEASLIESRYILEAMVYGNPIYTGGEEVRAVIVPDYEKIGADKDVMETISREVRAINASLAGYKRIKGFILRDEELPKTATKKIKRHLVKIDTL